MISETRIAYGDGVGVRHGSGRAFTAYHFSKSARILRTFLKRPGSKNIPIVAIGLSLYEDIPQKEGPEEEAGVEIIRTQWLDFSTIGVQDLIGKKILIVDEVDDTRTV
jgi:hypoxanthine phosphoribosyltransferase